MKMKICIFLLMTLFPYTLIAAEIDDRAEDRSAIIHAALDYIEGWYIKNPERMERALHYDMVKQRAGIDDRGHSYLDQGSALRLVQATRSAPGEDAPSLKNQKRDVTILDIYGNAASVKIDATNWVDYLHMVKWNGEWRILNVLWELKTDK